MSETTTHRDAAEHDNAYRLVVGECRIETTGMDDQRHRGQVVVVIKPDGTVLVHDVSGYQPVAWLTRAETVSWDAETGSITAADGDDWLRIEIDQAIVDRRLPGSPAGHPVGVCPTCGGSLVSARGSIHCVACHDHYGIPDDAELLEDRCACGLPRMRVERGEAFELCIDRTCEPLDEHIADRFDGVWTCPSTDCAGSLRVLRRSGLLLGCNNYPDCETAYRFPAGTLAGHCGCGLPRFTRNGESHCLDATCEVGH